MKKYEAPIVELTKFDVEDVITASVAPIDVLDANVTKEDLLEFATDIADAGNGLGNVFSW